MYYWFYRRIMTLAHKFDWHYMPVLVPLEDGRRQAWCTWCGLRDYVYDPLVAHDEIRAAAKRLGIEKSQSLHSDTAPAQVNWKP